VACACRPSNRQAWVVRISALIRGGDSINAIDQATLCLLDALSDLGHDCDAVEWRAGALVRATAGTDVLVVPYNPFMWARWGFAPHLLADVARVRGASSRPRIALVVHEPYVPINSVRSLVMGSWQRAQLAALLLLADARFASIEVWATKFGRFRPVAHLPSGSTLPTAGASRESVRSALGLDGSLVFATLSTGHPTHLTAYVELALRRLAGRDGQPPVAFLQLGAGSAHVDVPSGIRVEMPGRVDADRLAALLSSADILMTPFVDGVSTRRTSYLAGLQQGVAVVGTSGPLTDPMLTGRGLELVPVGNPTAFAVRVDELAMDAQRRERVAVAGRNLFETEFTWAALADRFLHGLRGGRSA
jgi:hypothetical protein